MTASGGRLGERTIARLTPRRPWVMEQHWQDVLFVHWPYRPEVLRPLVPAMLDIEEREGSAWISVVALRMAHLRLRGLSRLAVLHDFAELNLRTYVSHQGNPGVWFLRIDAASELATQVGRRCFHAPYHHVDATISRGSHPIDFAEHAARGPGPETMLRYEPTGDPIACGEDSLVDFLTARDCLYTVGRRKVDVLQCDVDHQPWTLYHADAHMELDAFLRSGHVPPPVTRPMMHWAHETTSKVMWPRRLTPG